MTIITTIVGKSYAPEDIVQAIQEHIGRQGVLVGDITHVFRACRQWQQEKKGTPYAWKSPHEDYQEYEGGTLPDCALRYFMEVVEPALRAQPSAHSTRQAVE